MTTEDEWRPCPPSLCEVENCNHQPNEVITLKYSVYTAGPITGQTYDESVDWREEVSEALAPDIITYSPLRFQAYLRDFGRLEDQYHETHPLVSQHGLTARDRFDVRRADAVLVNFLGAQRASIGTCVELGWADAFGKPIVIAMEEENIHRHAMVAALSPYILPTLEEAVDVLREVLLP